MTPTDRHPTTRDPASAAARRPDFFIVGAAKCGTTAMHDYLGRHPEVFMPERKEINFFGRDLAIDSARPDADAYRALFAAARDEKRVGEASVLYLYSATAAAEIHAFNPAADIIVMLRNPVDALYSLHSQMLFNGVETIADFEAALAAEPDRKAGRRLPVETRFRDRYLYRERVRFAAQVERYAQVFGRDHVHVVLFDDFASDPAATYRETLRFLGVDDTFLPAFEVVNPNKTPRSGWLQDVLWRPPPALLRLGRAALPDAGLRRRLLGRLRRANVRYVERPPMDPALRRRLTAELAPEIERLAAVIGRDLGHWCRAEPDDRAVAS